MMELRFEVGSHERHVVVYSWDQMWGRLSLVVDGVNVLKTRHMLSFDLVRADEVTVGGAEKHQVRVEKRRDLFFAGFRPQIVTAFVDGERVAEGVSNLSRQQVRSLIIFGIVLAVVVIALAVVAVVAAFSFILRMF
jgi:nitrate reductase NapE component